MSFFDLPLDQLRSYAPTIEAPEDFNAFWAKTVNAAADMAAPVSLQQVDSGLRTVETYDVTFSGFNGEPIRAWLHLPTVRQEPLGCVVQYIGYNGGRGLPHQWTLWASAGYAHFVMDTRGQGTGTCPGATPDPHGSGPASAGFLTRGIDSPTNYFYRRVFTDAVRALETATALPQVDAGRVVALGGSQGGGITLAVAGLSGMGLAPQLAGAAPDVPFLCHFRRAAELCDTDPYVEITRYLSSHRDKVESVFATLSYFDGVTMAAHATAPGLFSVGLMDTTCPPSTVFAAYNAYRGEKKMLEYPFNNHEGGGVFQEVAAMSWVRELLG